MNPSAGQELRQRLEGAAMVPLTLSLLQLSGDEQLLEALRPHVRGAWEHLAAVPPELAASIRERLACELERIAAGGAPACPVPPPELMQRMMAVAVGEPVHEQYIPMLLEHMRLEGLDAPPPTAAREQTGLSAVVIGAGASGICAAVRLAEAGIAYTVFEKNPQLGGTWYENRYPGCAVDTPNHFYQFSFEPNNDWPDYFSRQPSIRAYLEHCAHKYGVLQHLRLSCEVDAAHYDETRKLWQVQVRTGEGKPETVEANFLICAVGQLNRPMIPALPGLQDFAGQVLHTGAWAEGSSVKGKRVALIGTGASAVQVGPAIVDEVASLHVMQRSGAWVVRRPGIDKAVSEDKKWALKNLPYYAAWYRFQLFWAFGDGLFEALKIDPDWDGGQLSISAYNAQLREAMLRHMKRELEGDEALLQKVIPSYPPFGKRVLGDAGWYRMLRREHVELVTTDITRVEPQGLRLSDGSLVEVDTLLFATGFQAGKMLWPMDIRGRGGVSIREVWGDDNPRAYLGITVPDFPNLFVLYGPNTNVGHGGSAIFLAECQVRYTVSLLKGLLEKGAREAEVRREVHDQYNTLIDQKLSQLAWSHPSVTTWYKNSQGRIVTNQPWRLVDYWQLTLSAKMDEYRLRV
ncbi:MAG: NAD(P)/FAD-dependent oxidoreductase [Betaproteobacteria bacterium]